MGNLAHTTDLITLNAHMTRPRMIAGIETGRWEVLEQEGTNLAVRVFGRDYDSGLVVQMEFRLECDGLPELGPHVYLWDNAKKDRPTPPAQEMSTPGVVDALKDWGRPGGIYRAWQRYAANHGDWHLKRPEEAWHRDRDITFIMERLYEIVSEHAAWQASKTASPNL
jgi:hypothetical protein